MQDPDETDSERAQRNADVQRLKLVHNEVDLLIEDSFRRQESVSNKASFLAVASGIVLAGLTAQMWDAPAIFPLASMVLTVLALGLSAAALVPAKRPVLDARRLVDRYVDSTVSRVKIETSILDSKATAWSVRNSTIERHAFLVKTGFWVLVSAAVVFGVGFVIHYI